MCIYILVSLQNMNTIEIQISSKALYGIRAIGSNFFFFSIKWPVLFKVWNQHLFLQNPLPLRHRNLPPFPLLNTQMFLHLLP